MTTDDRLGWLGIPGLPQPQWARDVDDFVFSAAEAARWITEQPSAVRRQMLMSTVHCQGGAALLWLYRLPWDSPFVRGRRLFRRRFLVVPSSRATFDDGRPAKPLWVITMRDKYVVRCRCHTGPVAITAADLPGRTDVPNLSVVPSSAARHSSRRR